MDDGVEITDQRDFLHDKSLMLLSMGQGSRWREKDG
jgi:hypothetical protein